MHATNAILRPNDSATLVGPTQKTATQVGDLELLVASAESGPHRLRQGRKVRLVL
jgi:hypothetical protein